METVPTDQTQRPFLATPGTNVYLVISSWHHERIEADPNRAPVVVSQQP
jgi:hypothetical protein